jgi:hypothetical protein
MLIVVKDRDVNFALQPILDLETASTDFSCGKSLGTRRFQSANFLYSRIDRNKERWK